MRFALISRAVLVSLALAAPAAAQPGADLGTLAVTVRPAIADVFIDGNRWVSSDPSAPLEVRLAPGRHSIDVRARGYQRFSTIVDVRAGESTPLNVSLLMGSTPPQLRGPSAPPFPRPGQIQQVSVEPSNMFCFPNCFPSPFRTDDTLFDDHIWFTTDTWHSLATLDCFQNC